MSEPVRSNVRIVSRLSREELVARVEAVFQPAGKGLSSSDINDQLLEFCINCPDPCGAMDAVLEAPTGASAAGVVAQALRMQPRASSTWSEHELAADHPLRHWKLTP
jgi:hypothetical protein